MRSRNWLLWISAMWMCVAIPQVVVAAEITILSTMVASFTGEGEWGFSALIETDDQAILFDTGFKEQTVLSNARQLGKDLSRVEKVVLTHFHTDHSGGLLTLRKAHRAKNENALKTVYVAKGFFQQRYDDAGVPGYSLNNPGFTESFTTPQAFRSAAEALGIEFVVVSQPREIAPGIILSGPIERLHDEKNVGGGFFLRDSGDDLKADTVPESQVVGIRTVQGWVLLSGCGHAGIVNASAKLKTIFDAPIVVGIGGFHLFKASEETIAWTANQLGLFGYQKFVGAHCTGAYATHRIGQLLHMPRESLSIGAVGTRLDERLNIFPASID